MTFGKCTKVHQSKDSQTMTLLWPTRAAALSSSCLSLSDSSWFEWCELKMKTSMSFAGAVQYPLHDPFPLAATARLG